MDKINVYIDGHFISDISSFSAKRNTYKDVYFSSVDYRDNSITLTLSMPGITMTLENPYTERIKLSDGTLEIHIYGPLRTLFPEFFEELLDWQKAMLRQRKDFKRYMYYKFNRNDTMFKTKAAKQFRKGYIAAIKEKDTLYKAGDE